MWSRRNLSLFGKIEVIKRYALAKIIFPATVLEIEDGILKTVSSLFHNYLWGKKDRIKRTTLKNKVENGGLNMIDIESFCLSLKAAWIPRLLSLHGKWKAGFETLCAKINLPLEYILKMNFKSSDEFQVFGSCNKFYVNILIAYNKCKTVKDLRSMNEYDTLNSPLWGNTIFSFRNSCLYFKEWVDSNILYVKDLVNKTGVLKSENELYAEIHKKQNIIEQLYIYKNCLYKKLKYKQVVNAHFTQISRRNEIIFKGKYHNLEDKKTSFFYKILTSKVYQCRMESIYSREFEIECSRQNWTSIYTRKVKAINEIKLKEFNFKLLQNIVPCGRILSKWKANISENCNVCNEIETARHMLFECEKVKQLWIVISQILLYSIKWKDIVIGIPDYNCRSEKINFYNIIISVVAYAIFKENSHSKFNETSYANINLKHAILRNVLFYGNVNFFLAKGNYYKKMFQRFIDLFSL